MFSQGLPRGQTVLVVVWAVVSGKTALCMPAVSPPGTVGGRVPAGCTRLEVGPVSRALAAPRELSGAALASMWQSSVRLQAHPSLAALQRQPSHPDSEDQAQPPDFPDPCSPNRRCPFTNPPQAMPPGEQQWRGFKRNPTSCPSFATMWSWWPPSTLSVAAAAREDSHHLKQKREAMSVKFVTGNIPERAEPHAMLLNRRGLLHL